MQPTVQIKGDSASDVTVHRGHTGVARHLAYNATGTLAEKQPVRHS